MKTRTKMMLMNTKRHDQDREPRYDYGYNEMRMNYPMEAERSGSRGYRRGGDSYPIYPSSMYGEDMGGRFRNDSQRRRDKAGRFSSAYSHFPNYPFVPPVYQRGERGDGAMNRIGFEIPAEMNEEYGSYMDMPRMNEMAHHSTTKEHGHASSMGYAPFTYQTAMEWVNDMDNSDGSHGPHWTMEQTKEVQEKKGIDCDPIEFFVAMNMMYSDYCKVAKRYNVNSSDFYASMAKAFLDDKDAAPEKLMRYYEHVVQH